MIVTGVHSVHDCEWLFEEEVDLDWEERLEEEEYPDSYGPDEAGVTLYGQWIRRKDGLWEVAPDAEWAATWRPDSFTVHVLKSTHCIHCACCSPCYPGQGDTDIPPGRYGDLWAYILPPDLINEEWIERNRDRIKVVSDVC